MDLDELGRRVQAARLDRRWGKEHAARQAGLSSITWKRVEDGHRVQDFSLKAVLDVLDLDDEGRPQGSSVAASRLADVPSDDLLAELRRRLLDADADPIAPGRFADYDLAADGDKG